jgi:hypothetical protein
MYQLVPTKEKNKIKVIWSQSHLIIYWNLLYMYSESSPLRASTIAASLFRGFFLAACASRNPTLVSNS